MRLLKKSTARDILVFMTDDSDHVTGKTGLTLTITASKNAAAFAAITPTVTERGNGWYKLALTAAHTDTVGDFALHITGTDADPADVLCQVSAYLLDDIAAKTNLINAGGSIPVPVGSDDDGVNLTLTIRDDYTNENGQPLDIPLPSGWPDITGVPLTDIHLGFGPEFGDPEFEVTATEILESGEGVDQVVRFEPREASTTQLVPSPDWMATVLVAYPGATPGTTDRRSFNLNLDVQRSWVE